MGEGRGLMLYALTRGMGGGAGPTWWGAGPNVLEL